MRVDNFVTKPNSKEKTTIHIVHILDRSGSMQGGKIESALTGINAEIAELQKDTTVNYLFSLVDFGDYDVHRSYWQIPISQVQPVNIRANNGTPLYQAIGETLDGFPQTYPVLVKIFTDGGENTSRGKWASASAVKQLIDELEEKNFTITFVGTEYDVSVIQQTLNIAKGNTLVHDNTAEGVMRSFQKSMNATISYTNSVSRGEFTKTMSFYSESK